MASLSQSSTFDDAMNQYADNAAYWESETKAKALLEAVMWLQAHRAKQSAHGGSQFTYPDLDRIEERLVNHLGVHRSADNQTNFVKARPIL